jgi:hypothetical protein
MASLEWSPTTTKKLRFFSWRPLRMRVGIRESLDGELSIFLAVSPLNLQGGSHCLLGRHRRGCWQTCHLRTGTCRCDGGAQKLHATALDYFYSAGRCPQRTPLWTHRLPQTAISLSLGLCTDKPTPEPDRIPLDREEICGKDVISTRVHLLSRSTNVFRPSCVYLRYTITFAAATMDVSQTLSEMPSSSSVVSSTSTGFR